MSESKPENIESQPQENNVEKSFDTVDNLMQYEIREMRMQFSDFENRGKEGLQRAESTAGLCPGDIESIKEELGVEGKISNILERARELYEKTTIAMKKIAVTGMATMVISGIAGEVEGGMDIDTGEYSEIEHSQQENTDFIEETRERMKTIVESEAYFQKLAETFDGDVEAAERTRQEIIEIIQNAKAEEVKDLENFLNNEEEYLSYNESYGEETRARMQAMIESEAYLERLTKETGGDIQEAKRIQLARLKEIQSGKIIYAKGGDFLNGLYQEVSSRNIGNAKGRVRAFTFIPEDKGIPSQVVLPIERDIDTFKTEDDAHELSHVGTRRDEFIPAQTQERLGKLLKEDVVSDEHEKYFVEPAEVLARKQAIDVKMEKLGIKKYTEEYTQEHFDKLLEIEREQIGVKNDKELEEFIKGKGFKELPEGIEFMILYGREGIEKLFNEVADNGKNSIENDSQPQPS